jgi:small subunit ribosomal protein S16
MPAKIRLSRQGRKGRPFYHLVVADSRAPRDGRYIENLGLYNPLTNPATIEIDFDKALAWLQKGAQPTDTVRSILSYKGILMKHHLLNGVKKGAFSAEEAERRFELWLKEKENKIEAKKESLQKSQEEDVKQRLEAEIKAHAVKAEELAKKNAKAAEKEKEKENEKEEASSEEPATDQPAENPQA